jgi:DNA replication protein DnaC
LEVSQRSANAMAARIKAAGFPVLKDLDTYDFSAMPSVPKARIVELARGQWIEEKFNLCFVGNAGTGKTHLAIALGQAACRAGQRVKFFTAASLVTALEEAQKQYRLDRFLSQLDKLDLLLIDELGYLSFSRAGAELLFQIFADRYERASILVTSNLAFSDWGSIFQGERMTAALLDRFTHRCHIFEVSGESFRFRESAKAAKERKAKAG